MTTKTDTARDQAKAQLAHIVELMDWLDHAEDVESMRNDCDGENCTPPDGLGADAHDVDAAIEAIQENALDVEVNYGWHSVSSFTQPGESPKPEAFAILLCTGGPAVRIMGELFDSEVVNAHVEYQDWGTPWTELEFVSNEADEALLRYAQQFYFGQ